MPSASMRRRTSAIRASRPSCCDEAVEIGCHRAPPPSGLRRDPGAQRSLRRRHDRARTCHHVSTLGGGVVSSANRPRRDAIATEWNNPRGATRASRARRRSARAQASRSGTAASIAAPSKRLVGPCSATIAASAPAGVPHRRGDRGEPDLALLDRLGVALRAHALDLGRERGRVGDRLRRVRRSACPRGRGTSPNASITFPAEEAWPTLGRPSRVTPWR